MAAMGLSAPALAQEGGTLRGRVTDAQGNPMPAATVTIRSKANPSVNNQGTLTNAKGEYRMPLLPPGTDYEILCAFPGFATVIKRPVEISTGTLTTVEFIMIEEQVQKIEVVARGDVVDTEKTTTSTSVSTEFLAGLPILGRSYSDVLTLAPGVTDTDGDGQPNVKGSREIDFQFRISGVQTNNPITGDKALDFNIEAIEEIQILTGALTAEHSSQGGLSLVTTRSGGNEFEGSAKIFYQTRDIDGDGANNNDFTGTHVESPSFRTLRPFVTAGGALKKDRLWYFTALEYLDEQEPVIFGPLTRNSSREGHRDFFKVTWQINPEHKAAVEFHYEPTDTFGNNIAPTISDETDFHFDSIGHLYTARETAVFSPTVFLDSTLSLFSIDQLTSPVHKPQYLFEDERKYYSAEELGKNPNIWDFVQRTGVSIIPLETEFQPGVPYEGHYVQDADNRTVRGPFFINQRLEGKQFTLREDLSFYVDDWLGSHTLKSGVEFLRQDHSESTEFRPTIVREAGGRGQDGFIYSVAAPVPAGAVPLESERYNLAFYLQDTWKPLPNLTVNLGMRMDSEVVSSAGRTPFDPQAEVSEYNRLARLFYDNPSAAGNESGAGGQVRLGDNLNFSINPLTDRPYCDLDGDFTCDGRTSDGGVQVSGVPGNSDTSILKSIFTRDNFDCSRISPWFAATSEFSGSGRPCIGSEKFNLGQPLREGTDLQDDDISLRNANLAPRISFSYDPFADGKTKMYATWGRFYANLYVDTVVRERRADLQALRLGVPEESGAAPISAQEGGFSIYQVERDLRTPYTDEFTLGIERELAPELALKVIYTQKEGRDQLQDQDINHVTVDRRGGPNDTPDGILDDCLNGTQGVGTTCDPDGAPDIEPLNPNFNQIFLVGNFNTSDFRSLELVLTKRLHHNWQFETSYTWSEARGNAETFNSFLGDDPSQTELEDGFLAFDQRHIAKFNAIAHLPKEFQVGGSITYESGLPFSVVNRDFVSDNMGNVSFRTIFPTKQRNDQRNKSFWTFNANIKKALTFGGRVKGAASLDIFDILNSDDLRINSVNRANSQGLQVSDPVDPATRQFGRRFQIGLEFHF